MTLADADVVAVPVSTEQPIVSGTAFERVVSLAAIQIVDALSAVQVVDAPSATGRRCPPLRLAHRRRRLDRRSSPSPMSAMSRTVPLLASLYQARVVRAMSASTADCRRPRCSRTVLLWRYRRFEVFAELELQRREPSSPSRRCRDSCPCDSSSTAMPSLRQLGFSSLSVSNCCADGPPLGPSWRSTASRAR